MKKRTKVLSVILALAMALTMIPFASFAEAKTAEAFIGNENLANLAERLLKDLGARSDEIAGTVIQLVCKFVKDDSLQAAIGDTDLYNATDDELCDILVAWLNANLPEWTKDIPDWIGTITPILGVTLDLKTVDGVMKTLESVADNNTVKNAVGGTAKKLDATGLKDGRKVITVKNGYTNKDIIVALLTWLSADAQISVIKDVLMGKLSFGMKFPVNLNDTIGIDDLNNTLLGLPTTIKGFIYDLFAVKDAEGNKIAFADSIYKDYTADELLGVALIQLLKPLDEITKEEAANAATLTLYQLLGEYAASAIEKYLLAPNDKYAEGPLNGQFKNWLLTEVAVDTDENYGWLKAYINPDFNFTIDSFKLDGIADVGLFAKIGEILVSFFKTVFTADAIAAMGIEDGDNSKIQSNLDKVVTWFIDNMPEEFEGYNFAEVKANNATATLEEKAATVLGIFWNSWFGADYVIPAEAGAKSLEQVGAYAVYCAIDKFIVKANNERYADWAYGNFADVLMDGDKVIAKTDAELLDTIYNIGLKVAVYALNKNAGATDFVFTPDQMAEKDAAGWTYIDYADEIADWGINYIKGLPAIADELVATRGETDEFGPFYKLNVVLNKLLPLSILTDCGDGYFDCDMETMIMDKLFGSIFAFDISGVVHILDVNDAEGNIANMPVIEGVITLVEKVLFGLFEYDAAVGTEEFATETVKYVKGTNDKFYKITEVIAPDEPTTEPTTEEPTTEEPTTEEPTTEEPTTEEPTTEEPTTEPKTEPTTKEEPKTEPTTKEEPKTEPTTKEEPSSEEPSEEPSSEEPADIVYGDINGDGKVKANDARLALRNAAGLETITDDQAKAADVNLDGKVKANDARLILRFAAGLETVLPLAK